MLMTNIYNHADHTLLQLSQKKMVMFLADNSKYVAALSFIF